MSEPGDNLGKVVICSSSIASYSFFLFLLFSWKKSPPLSQSFHVRSFHITGEWVDLSADDFASIGQFIMNENGSVDEPFEAVDDEEEDGQQVLRDVCLNLSFCTKSKETNQYTYLYKLDFSLWSF
jgi:hypothetical protein